MNSLLVKETIEEFFKKNEQLDKQIFSQLAFYIYYLESKKTNSDLYILAKLIPEEYVDKLVDFYDGACIKMPSSEEYKKAYLLVICYYLKEIQRWDWNKIKKLIPIPIEYQDILSPISIGKKINLITENITHEFKNALFQYKVEDLIEKLENFKHVKRNYRKRK